MAFSSHSKAPVEPARGNEAKEVRVERTRRPAEYIGWLTKHPIPLPTLDDLDGYRRVDRFLSAAVDSIVLTRIEVNILEVLERNKGKALLSCELEAETIPSGTGSRTIEESIGTRKTIEKRLRKLIERGLVDKPNGKKGGYAITPKGSKKLAGKFNSSADQ